jgi:hypothetical protein
MITIKKPSARADGFLMLAHQVNDENYSFLKIH